MEIFIRQQLQHLSPIFAMVILCSAVAAGLNLASIAVVEQWLHSAKDEHLPWSWLIALVAVLFCTSLFSQLQLAIAGERLLKRIRHQLLSLLAAQSYARLQQLGPHRLMTSLTEDIYSIAAAFSLFPMFVINVGILMFSLLYLYTVSPSLLLLLLLILLVAGLLSFKLIQMAADSTERQREQQDKLYEVFRAATEGLRELNLQPERRLFFLEQVAKPCLTAVEHAGCRNQRHWAIHDSWTATFFIGGIFLLVFCGKYYLDATHASLQSFILFSIYLCGPVQVLAQTFDHIVKGKVALGRLKQLDLQPATSAGGPHFPDLSQHWQKLAVEDLSFSYQHVADSNFTLSSIDFELNRGEIVFIKGGNGSGKTTLIHLLLGLYQASGGRVNLDDRVVTDLTDPAYRRLFACIFSDGYVFEYVLNQQGSAADFSLIEPLLNRFGLTDITRYADGSFDTNAMSRGQLKRYALIQLLLQDAPICIFDEWAAEQDPQSRAYFYLELLPELKAQGRAVLVISHDDRYFDVADRLYSMTAGQLSQLSGKHQTQGISNLACTEVLGEQDHVS